MHLILDLANSLPSKSILQQLQAGRTQLPRTKDEGTSPDYQPRVTFYRTISEHIAQAEDMPLQTLSDALSDVVEMPTIVLHE